MTLKLTLECEAAGLYDCPAVLATVLTPAEADPPVTLHRAKSDLVALMQANDWAGVSHRAGLVGYCSTCWDRLEDLAAGVTTMPDPAMVFALLALADLATDSVETVRAWPREGQDLAARKAAKGILRTSW